MSKVDTFFENKEKQGKMQDGMTHGDIDKLREAELEALSIAGKEKYDLSNTTEKIETMLNMKQKPIDTSMSTLKAFNEAIENGRPIVTYSIGTTGLKKDDEIMQIAFRVYEEGNTGKYEEVDKLAQIVRASDDIIKRALETRSSYDIFKEGGFGLPVNKGGVGITEEEYLNMSTPRVHTKEDTAEKINSFLKQIDENYTEDSKPMFFGINPASMNKFATAIGIDMPKCYDVQDVFKENDFFEYDSGNFDYLNTSGGKYTFVNMCTDTIGIDTLYSTYQKAGCEMEVLKVIAKQWEHLKENDKAIEADKWVDESLDGEIKESASIREGVSIPMGDNIPFPGGLDSMPDGHGNLYSDKQGDTMDVVTADNVQKVGEASIPHVSEYRDKTTNELLNELIIRQERTEALLEKLVASVSKVVEIPIEKSSKELMSAMTDKADEKEEVEADTVELDDNDMAVGY